MEYIAYGFKEAVRLLVTFDKEIFSIVNLSLYVSSLSTLIAALIGVPIGVFLAKNNFLGKRIFVRVVYTLMGTPPVIMGLVVFLIIMRRGPLGHLQLSFTKQAMIIAQASLITPIITGLTYNEVNKKAKTLTELALTLGASKFSTLTLFITESKAGIFTAVITGLGRGISEVGAVMIVGGNIKGHTRVMTTYISQLQGMGEYSKAIAIGIILLLISFIINSVLYTIQYKKEV